MSGCAKPIDFNPHSPCGERREAEHIKRLLKGFQSTLPVWGATCGSLYGFGLAKMNFNPHSPCGERLCYFLPILFQQKYFNPHSPCGERLLRCLLVRKMFSFQSTLPVWGATKFPDKARDIPSISIHTPRVGSDDFALRSQFFLFHFNPHSPCGERPPSVQVVGVYAIYFNPHSPCGERPRFPARFSPV